MADTGGGGKTQKTESKVEPWGPSQPGLKQSIADATGLYNSGGLTVNYPTTTVAPVAPEQGLAWYGIAERAQAGSPLLDQSQGYLSDVLSGKYLTADAPGLQETLDRARRGVNENYSVKGRYGSGPHDDAVTSALAPYLFGNYARERGVMDTAAGMAPGQAREDYYDLDRLGQVGAERRGVAQEFVSDEAARQQWEQQQAANRIALYQQLLRGDLGGTTTAWQPGQSVNPWLLAGGAATSLAGSYLGAGGTFGL